MSQFTRKDQGSGFKASERRSVADNVNAEAPDFSALEPQSGFSADDLAGQQTAPEESPSAAPSRVKPAEEAPAKKRYYSPNEVMRKKGCIGCGGMVLAVPFLVTAIGIAIAIL